MKMGKGHTMAQATADQGSAVHAGVLEPAMSKIKSLQFATEAAMTLLRIDDMIKMNPPAEQ